MKRSSHWELKVFTPIQERVEKATILGLLITQDMKWNAHVDKITTN
jgi:hypothetical protein